MADTAATASAICPGHVDAVIPVSPDKCVLTIPRGVNSLVSEEAIADLEVSHDEGTTWAALATTEGRVLWSSRTGSGGTMWLRLSSGADVTRPLLSRNHL